MGKSETRKMKITTKDISSAINEAINKSKSGLMDMTGDSENHSIIEPVAEPSIEDVPVDAGGEENVEVTDDTTIAGDEGMLDDTLTPSSPPSGLLDILNTFDEAKSNISKIAVEEQNEDIKKALYAYYEKIGKLSLELIKDFQISH